MQTRRAFLSRLFGSALAHRIGGSALIGLIWARLTRAQRAPVAFWKAAARKLLLFDSSTTSILGSLDGISWTPQQLPTATTTSPVWSGLAGSGSNFCAVGPNGWIVTSPDGSSWTSRTAPTVYDWSSVAWNGTVYCAVGSSATAASTDGSSWVTSTQTAALSICARGSLFCAVYTNALSGVSSDGLNWTASTQALSSSCVVAANGSIFCAVGTAGQGYKSSNGLTWTSSTLPSGSTGAVTWASAVWNGTIACTVAFGTNTAAYSGNGLSWTAATLPTSANWTSLAWNGTRFCAVAKGSNQAATSTDGVSWSAATLPSSANWSAIAWNGSVFAAVCRGAATAARSSDGITWTAQTAVSGVNWSSLATNGSLFVSMANYPTNKSMSSPDGVTWTQRTLPVSAAWGTAFWAGSQFVGLSSNGYPYTVVSSDGINWTSVTNGSNQLYAAATNGSTAVGVGSFYFGSLVSGTWTVASNYAPTLQANLQFGGAYVASWCGSRWVINCSVGNGRGVFTSTDGTNWSFQANVMPAAFATQPNYIAITALGSKFCAITSQSAATSPDGSTWTYRSLPSVPGGGDWVSVASNGTSFCVVGTGGYSVTSTDGVSWSAATMPTSANWTTVGSSGTTFSALASYSLNAATSSSGLTWTSQTTVRMPIFDVGGAGVRAANRFCVVSNNFNYVNTANDSVFISSDGYSWLRRTLPKVDYWTDVAWNGSVFCAIAANSQSVATSPDTQTWTLRTIPRVAGWNQIRWNKTVFCAIDYDELYTAASTDGTNWTMGALPYVDYASSISLETNGTLFVAIVGYSAYSVYTSIDGINWTGQSLSTAYEWAALAWNGTVFCAVASNSAQAATSSDGINWVLRTLPSSDVWSAIQWTGALFCVAANGSNALLTSPDGINWTTRTLPTSNGWANFSHQ